MTEILPTKKDQQLSVEITDFANYLKKPGLPTENIIAPYEERLVIGSNLPILLDSLPAEIKKDARYLSKFFAATAMGLFDAALNYVWNEVVLNLRKKAVIYGLDLFYDVAVGESNRSFYKDENNLDGLKDSVLLHTCRKLELISDVVHKKLDHILTMRNEVAASHPNVESIGGYELLGWLQTCVKDVLQDKPSDSAIRIRSLVNNLKSSHTVIDGHTIASISSELKNLSTPHVNNLLITIFGMYVSPDSDQIMRTNISHIAKLVWEYSEDRVKYTIGTTIDGYRNNLQVNKIKYGIEFLKIVDGRMYESLPSKTIAIVHLADKLEETHDGMDNYYHEPVVMAEILSYCKKSTDIPSEAIPKLTKAIILCRIGKGISYREGVSPAGAPLYDKFILMLNETGIVYCIIALFDPEIYPKLDNSICQQHLKIILQNLFSIAVSDRLKQIINYLNNNLPRLYKVLKTKKFKDLATPYLKFHE